MGNSNEGMNNGDSRIQYFPALYLMHLLRLLRTVYTITYPPTEGLKHDDRRVLFRITLVCFNYEAKKEMKERPKTDQTILFPFTTSLDDPESSSILINLTPSSDLFAIGGGVSEIAQVQNQPNGFDGGFCPKSSHQLSERGV